ncbi:hypothetical protein MNBD_GAMMA21-1112 [hydrothermal vent metagenome]|uniref:Uncharacterized protein n=1 Tax=hydrothermal vent metagenome TaxID=652676 RepID=A0A3B1ALU9_9ZZZZ
MKAEYRRRLMAFIFFYFFAMGVSLIIGDIVSYFREGESIRVSKYIGSLFLAAAYAFLSRNPPKF